MKFGNFQHILLPVSIAGLDANRTEFASFIRRLGSSTLTLVHVIELVRDVPYAELESFYKDIENKARNKLVSLCEEIHERDVSCAVQIVYGDRATEIVKMAEDLKVDLIILHSDRPDQDNDSDTLGSIPFKVTALSSCPTLIMK
jgi:nucleotide-binding universal stress UspA family protein